MFGMAWLNIHCVVYTRFTLEILRRSFKDCDTHSLEQLKLRHKKLMCLLTVRGHGHRQQSFQYLSPKLKATRTDTPNWVARTRAGLWLSCFSSGQLCVAFATVRSSNTPDDDQSFFLESQEGPGSNHENDHCDCLFSLFSQSFLACYFLILPPVPTLLDPVQDHFQNLELEKSVSPVFKGVCVCENSHA